MISCYLTGEAWICLHDIDGNDISEAVRVLPPSPSRWLLPSHHPSEGECRVVKCERLCDTADLGSPDTMTFKYESVQ